MSEVRTPKGKLVGMVDVRAKALNIKDGKKTTTIEIPDTGLKVHYCTGTGEPEAIYIPPMTKAQQMAQIVTQ